MKITDIANKPHVYLDMDGVQADFFTAWAKAFGKERYKEIGDRPTREASIDELNQRGPEFIEEFFANLPVLPGGSRLVTWLKTNGIPFTVLSAPLRGNHEASIRGKRRWLDQHNPGTSATAIFDGMKERFANRRGVPAILIDDHKKYIERWNDAGGIALLYREHNVDDVIAQLKKIYSS